MDKNRLYEALITLTVFYSVAMISNMLWWALIVVYVINLVHWKFNWFIWLKRKLSNWGK